MDYKFPLRVGITGPRKLTQEDAHQVREEIDAALAWIRDKADKQRIARGLNNEFYISGLTPVAEGADRIFADEVLKHGGKLELVLPFRPDIYREDFATNESKADFVRLLCMDKCPLIIDALDKPHKEWAYYHSGKMVADQCDILIVVWDGNEAKGPAGTGNILDYAKKNKNPAIIIHIGENKKTEYVHLNNIEFKEYEVFCRECGLPGENSATASPEFDVLTNRIGVSESESLAKLFGLFSTFDYAAIHLKKVHEKFIKVLYILAFLASLTGIVAIILENLGAHHFGYHLLEAIFLLLAALWFVYIKNKSKHKKWIQARVWAEKARVQIFKIVCSEKKYENADENLPVLSCLEPK